MTVYGHLAAPRLTALGRLTCTADVFRADPPQKPVLYHSGDDFRDLFSLEELDNVLSFGGRRRPDFRVIRDGAQIPDSHYTRSNLMYSEIPDTRKITHELTSGSTLVMQGVQEYHEPLSGFARRLAHDLSRPVHVNAYVTPPKAQGFGSHFDPQDAFIVQVEGSKDWTLRKPALPKPLAHESWAYVQRRHGWDTQRLEEPEPWQELTLHPGDCLWLPRGWVHSARSGGVTSLHLTLSFTAWTEHWAVLELMSRLADAPGRTELPAGFISDHDGAIAAVARLRAELAHWFEQVPDAELVRILRGAAFREFPPPPRQVCALTADDAITPDLEFAVRPETILAAVPHGERLALQLADRVISLPPDAAAVCADILGREHFTVGELGCDQHPSVRADAVRVLWREGIIERRPG